MGSELSDHGRTLGAHTPLPAATEQHQTRRAALYAARWVLANIPAHQEPTVEGRAAGHTTARQEILSHLLDELGLNGRPITMTRQARRAARRSATPEQEDT